MITAYFNSTYIIVGAESKVVDVKTHKASHDECKVTRLGQDSFFAGTGLQYVTMPESQQHKFDGVELAKRAFNMHSSLSEIVQSWISNMEEKYTELLSDEPDVPWWKEDKPMGSGIFGGMDGDELSLYVAHISYTVNNRGFHHTIEKKVPRDMWLNFGTIDATEPYIKEFLEGKTERSRRVHADINEYVKDLHINKLSYNVIIARNIIEATIAWSAGSIPEIGGNISVLILEKGKPNRWFRQSDLCGTQ